MAVLPSVKALVDDVVSEDKAVKARCELALQLATQLDLGVELTANGAAGAVGATIPALSKELRAAIDDIASIEGKKQAFVADIFAP